MSGTVELSRLPLAWIWLDICPSNDLRFWILDFRLLILATVWGLSAVKAKPTSNSGNPKFTKRLIEVRSVSAVACQFPPANSPLKLTLLSARLSLPLPLALMLLAVKLSRLPDAVNLLDNSPSIDFRFWILDFRLLRLADCGFSGLKAEATSKIGNPKSTKRLMEVRSVSAVACQFPATNSPLKLTLLSAKFSLPLPLTLIPTAVKLSTFPAA